MLNPIKNPEFLRLCSGYAGRVDSEQRRRWEEDIENVLEDDGGIEDLLPEHQEICRHVLSYTFPEQK